MRGGEGRKHLVDGEDLARRHVGQVLADWEPGRPDAELVRLVKTKTLRCTGAGGGEGEFSFGER